MNETLQATVEPAVLYVGIVAKILDAAKEGRE